MSLITTGKSGSSFAPIEAGTYAAVCYMVVDLGEQESEYQGAKYSNRKVQIGWEIPELMIQGDGEDTPRVISKRYTNSINEKATLKQHLEAWRGKAFTDEELAGFDLRNIIGACCLLQVNHKEVSGKTYATVQGILAMPKGMVKPKGICKPVTYDIDHDPISKVEELPEWLKKIVTESESYKAKLAEASLSPTEFAEVLGEVDGDLPF